MELEIQILISVYKEEIERLINENILLKAQLKQIKNDEKNNI